MPGEVCDFQEKLLRTLALCNNGKATAARKNAADQFGNAYCDGEASAGEISVRSLRSGGVCFLTSSPPVGNKLSAFVNLESATSTWQLRIRKV